MNYITKFYALAPEPKLDLLIREYKQRVLDIAGQQLYLSDPPHLTLYLATFPIGFQGAKLVAELSKIFAPTIRLIGWHFWIGDLLTGNNTLVCDIHPDDKTHLRAIQSHAIETLSPHRESSLSSSRFANRWSLLSYEQQLNVETTGFPYLYSGWEPHISIASITPGHWEQTMQKLIGYPPIGQYRLTSLDEYVLIDNHPVLQDRIVLVGQ